MTLRQLLLPFLGYDAPTAPPDNHHLRRKPSGYFQARITIDQGEKFVGKRLIIGLKTRHIAEARERRDLVLEALKAAGVTLHQQIKHSIQQ